MPAERKAFVDVTERMVYLRSIPVATALPPPVLRAVATAMRDRSFEVGEVIMREGEPIRAMHLLTSGKLDLVKGGKQIGSLAPPQSLGFLGILAGGEGTYDATVVEEVTCLELEADALLELLEDHLPLLVATMRYLAQRLYFEIADLPAEMVAFPFDPPIEDDGSEIDLVRRLLFLRTISGFKRTNLASLALVARQLEEVRCPPGTRLWSHGDAAPYALFIARGSAKCERADGSVFRYGPGTAMGGIESFADMSRWYTATSEGEFLALRGKIDVFLDILEDNFSMAMDFITTFSEALVGLLARKAAMGQSTIGAKRDVSKLGAVAVGA